MSRHRRGQRTECARHHLADIASGVDVLWAPATGVSISLRSPGSVVIGRACSHHSCPALSIAHSRSIGLPQCCAARSAPVRDFGDLVVGQDGYFTDLAYRLAAV